MDDNIVAELKSVVGEEWVSTDAAELYVYGSDSSIHQGRADAVVKPGSIEEVQGVVRVADKHAIPVTPRGSGTSLAGNAVPARGGIVLDMKRMDTIIRISLGDLYAVVEPGVINDALNAELAKDGFFFPPTPASGKVATIGGMIGNNASGSRALKYGTTKDAVLGMKVVLANGELVEFGTRTIKHSSGYHLERLIIGSEGTLGIVVEATLKITPVPGNRALALASFPRLENAGQGVSNLMASGMLPSSIEIMDKVCIDAVNKSMGTGLPECEALLLVEVDGHPVAVKEDIEKVGQILKETGAMDVEYTTEAERMEQLWDGRRGILPSLSRFGDAWVSMSLADDMDVPLSRMAETVKAFQDIAKRNDIIIGTYGHAGDGNVHTKVLFDPKKAGDWERAKKAVDEVYQAVAGVGGTTSGEHGIGLSKAKYMKLERSDSLEVMKAIKKALDPKGILNPGKLWDAGDDFRRDTPLRYPVEGSQ